MNYSMIIYLLGCVLEVEGAALLIPFIIGLVYHENAALSFLIGAAICLVVGTALIVRKPKNNKFYAKEGFVTVALAWIIMSLLGAIPFVINEDIPNYLTAVFETVSGFTTTGSSNIPDIESLSHASLFWRSETHWLGGVGVIMFILAFVRLAGGYSMALMKAESPGPTTDKFGPKMRNTAVTLYGIYTILTLLEFVILLLCKIPWFDAITTAFGTAGTGGFAVRSASIGAYNNPAAEIVITLFMIIFGANFNVYYLFYKRKFKEAFKNEELIVYIGIVIATIGAITANVMHLFHSFGEALRNSAFTVASIISSTGFATADYDTWPTFSRILLVLIMFCGACAGSTGGGMKVSRIIILFKSGVREIKHAVRPRSVVSVKLNGKKVPGETTKNIMAYLILEMALIAGSIIFVSIDGFDPTTTVTAVITCFHNIGPGLGVVGPTGNFVNFSVISKIVLIFDMLAGRLEIMPLLVLFSPNIWRKD